MIPKPRNINIGLRNCRNDRNPLPKLRTELFKNTLVKYGIFNFPNKFKMIWIYAEVYISQLYSNTC